jgi:hypothetical protein
MTARFAPNVLDSQLDCTALAMGEFKWAVAEAIEPLVDFAVAVERSGLLLKLRPKWPRRSFKKWGR